MHVELLGIFVGLLHDGSCVAFWHSLWNRPASQTQADAGGIEVMFTEQLEHRVPPANSEIDPFGHSLHTASPLPLNLPGGHRAQSGSVFVASTSVGDTLP